VFDIAIFALKRNVKLTNELAKVDFKMAIKVIECVLARRLCKN